MPRRTTIDLDACPNHGVPPPNRRLSTVLLSIRLHRLTLIMHSTPATQHNAFTSILTVFPHHPRAAACFLTRTLFSHGAGGLQKFFLGKNKSPRFEKL